MLMGRERDGEKEKKMPVCDGSALETLGGTGSRR